MKFLIIFWVLFICCVYTVHSQPIDSIITTSSLYNNIQILSSDSLQGRGTGTQGEHNAAVFIADKFRKAGLSFSAGNDSYFQHFFIQSGGKRSYTKNVIGILPGTTTSEEVIIMCAHYDHLGSGIAPYGAVTTDFKDTIFNGANDNASGVAVLMEIANYYAAIRENKYTILFIAFSAEELGLIGSKYLSENMDKKLLKGVINFDMLGRPFNKKQKSCMVIGADANKIIRLLNSNLLPGAHFFVRDQFPLQHLNERMDHSSFSFCKNAFSITAATDNDEFYHSPHDEINTLDFGFLTQTTKNIAIACKALINKLN